MIILCKCTNNKIRYFLTHLLLGAGIGLSRAWSSNKPSLSFNLKTHGNFGLQQLTADFSTYKQVVAQNLQLGRFPKGHFTVPITGIEVPNVYYTRLVHVWACMNSSEWKTSNLGSVPGGCSFESPPPQFLLDPHQMKPCCILYLGFSRCRLPCTGKKKIPAFLNSHHSFIRVPCFVILNFVGVVLLHAQVSFISSYDPKKGWEQFRDLSADHLQYFSVFTRLLSS